MNAVNGTKFKASFPMFTGSFRNAKYSHEAIVSGTITNDTCYDSNNKHWVYFTCTESNCPEFSIGSQYKKQGKNFYSAVTNYEYPTDYAFASAQKDLIKTAHLLGNKAIGAR